MSDNSGVPELAIGDVITPKSGVGIVFWLECEAIVAKGDPVYLSSANKISPAASAQDCIGIAMKNGIVGDVISVAGPGHIVKVVTGGSITLGKAVMGADGSRRVLMLTDQAVNEGGSANYTVWYNRKLGMALQASTGAGQFILIYLCR